MHKLYIHIALITTNVLAKHVLLFLTAKGMKQNVRMIVKLFCNLLHIIVQSSAGLLPTLTFPGIKTTFLNCLQLIKFYQANCEPLYT